MRGSEQYSFRDPRGRTWEVPVVQPDAVAFIGALVWRFPQLLDAFGQHLLDNDGEVRPHVFMAEVERWAERLVSERRELVVSLLRQLDEGVAADRPAVVNLIDVSFVENLPYDGEPGTEVRDLLPTRLRALLRH